MPERNSIENQVRDWLSINLDVIDSNLKLIQKEYYLPDTIGSKGFVDLLCKDQYENFVIIEVKRSETAARQTINEILKYHSLLQQNFRARESEIRIIVVSTSWGELIRPFSETINRTSIDLTGYRIALDEFNIPVAIEKVEPRLPEVQTRAFSYYYGLYLFGSDTKRTSFYEVLKKYIIDKGFTDFVLLNATGDLGNERVYFPYGIILAFQRMSTEQLIEAIGRLDKEVAKHLCTLEDFEMEEEFIDHLEASLINAIAHNGDIDESESCYPQKINVMIDAEHWKVGPIERFGIFSTDPRYSEQLLLTELRGLDGPSENRYFAATESSQKEKVKEIQRACRNSLAHTPVWLDTLDVLMDKLRMEDRKFSLSINISNPDSLMVSIYHAVSKKQLSYLPIFQLEINYHDASPQDIYLGGISWNLNFPKSKYLKPFSAKEDGMLIEQIYILPDNTRDAANMSLNYTTAHYVVQNGKAKFKGFCEGRDGKLEPQDRFIFPFTQFAVTYSNELNHFIENHERSYVSF